MMAEEKAQNIAKSKNLRFNQQQVQPEKNDTPVVSKTTPTTSRFNMEDRSSEVESPTAKKFKEQIIDKGYKYKMGAKGVKGWDEENIDCSGAVCKVLGIKDPAANNSAAHFHDKSKPVKETEIQDGDLITMNTEGKKIDHIGFIVIDSNTGMPFIAESSSSFNSGKIVPLQERIDSLKTKYPNLKYYFRRL